MGEGGMEGEVGGVMVGVLGGKRMDVLGVMVTVGVAVMDIVNGSRDDIVNGSRDVMMGAIELLILVVMLGEAMLVVMLGEAMLVVMLGEAMLVVLLLIVGEAVGIILEVGMLREEVELAALARNAQASKTVALAISIAEPAGGGRAVTYRPHTLRKAQRPT